MRKFKYKGPIICILFAVVMLLIKDNFSNVWSIITTLASALTPIVYGFVIAYILNFPFRFFKERVYCKIGKNNKKWQKMVSPVSLVTTYLLVIGVIALLIGFIVPELVESIAKLAVSLPGYFSQFEVNVNNFIDWAKSTLGLGLEGISSLNDIIKQVISGITGDDLSKITQGMMDTIVPAAVSTSVALYNWTMGIILSIYMITSKDKLCRQMKRIAVAFIPIKWLPKIYEIVDVTDTKCGRFLVGKVIDSSIIGLMCFICMSVLHLEYAMLISVLVAICNIIPFFGPFISAIPAAFLLLIIDPLQSLIFVVMIIVLQQIDGNIIGPKVVGDKVGLIGFWALFSVIVGGGLFGFVGLILGTPVFAAIYTLLGKKVKNKIEEKGNIAQQALDFEVLKYTEIAAEQKRLRKQTEDGHHNISKFLQKEFEKKKNAGKDNSDSVKESVKESVNNSANDRSADGRSVTKESTKNSDSSDKIK